MRIELLKKGALDRVVADSVPVGVAGKGVYQWAIPDSLPFSQFYQIRVVGTNNPAAVDTSDTRVWIGQGVDINSPTTGDVVIQGGYILIDYTWSGVTKIKFDLYKAGQFLKNLQVAEISGYFDGPGWRWGTIGYTGTDTPFGPDYTIVATPVDDPTRAAELGLPNPFRTFTFDLTLLRAGDAPPAAQPADVQPTVVRGAPEGGAS